MCVSLYQKPRRQVLSRQGPYEACELSPLDSTTYMFNSYPATTFCLGKNVQGSHRLENYLNIQDYLEKSLKIKITLKNLKNTQRL